MQVKWLVLKVYECVISFSFNERKNGVKFKFLGTYDWTFLHMSHQNSIFPLCIYSLSITFHFPLYLLLCFSCGNEHQIVSVRGITIAAICFVVFVRMLCVSCIEANPVLKGNETHTQAHSHMGL
jgi:hypothetical protein